MNAKDIMGSHFTLITPDHSVKHAAQLLIDRNIGELLVVDDVGKLSGILTEGDLLRRVELGSANCLDEATNSTADARQFVRSHSWRVGDVMTTNVVVIDERASVSEIAEAMARHHIKRLPVVRNGKPIGIVGRRDLLRLIAERMLENVASGDAALRTSITARLREAEAFIGTVPEVEVSSGVVYLRGTIGTAEAHEAVRVIVDGVPGVEGLVDQLEVGDVDRSR